MGLLSRLAANVAALWVAAAALEDVRYDDFGTLVLAALVFGLVNAVLGMLTRPAARDAR